MKRNLLWIGVGVLALIAAALLWGIYGSHTISLTEAQIQERINAQLNKEIKPNGGTGFFVKSVGVKNATVSLGHEQLTALIEVEGTLRGAKKFSLTAQAVGNPEYSAGKFFFRPSAIEVREFSFEGDSPSEVMTRLAKRYLSDEKARQAVNDAAPKIESWMTTVAQNAATHVLDRRPVYTLKNDVKGVLIGAALESVKVRGDKLIINFSLWQLTLSVGIGLLCLLAAIGMLWGLIQYPMLGAAVITIGSLTGS